MYSVEIFPILRAASSSSTIDAPDFTAAATSIMDGFKMMRDCGFFKKRTNFFVKLKIHFRIKKYNQSEIKK